MERENVYDHARRNNFVCDIWKFSRNILFKARIMEITPAGAWSTRFGDTETDGIEVQSSNLIRGQT